MANALEAANILSENPDTGAMELSDSEVVSIWEGSLSLVENGTAASPGLTHVIPGVTQTLIPLEIPAMPDAAAAVREAGGNLEDFDAFANSFGNFLTNIAEFLNVSIDSPIGKPLGYIDPTIIIKIIKDKIQEVVSQIVDMVKEKLNEFKEHLGDKIEEFLDKIQLNFDELGIEEIIEKMVQAAAIIATIPLTLLEGIEKLLALFNIPAIEDIIESIVMIILNIQAAIRELKDLKNKIKNAIIEALAAIVNFIRDTIIQEVQDAIIAAVLALLNIPLPELPSIPEWVLRIPEAIIEFFNLQPPIINFNLMLPNIFSEILAFFYAILEFFTSIIPTLDFILALIAALAQGVAGLIAFLIEIVVGLFEAAFGLVAGAVLKVASVIVMINRVVRYLAIALVGNILGNGLIFEAIAKAIKELGT